MFRLRVPASFALLFLAACADGRSGEQKAAVCSQYLDCLDAIASGGGAAASAYKSTIDQARTQYGSGGACDTSAQTRQQCDQACSAGLSSASQAFPSMSACTPPVAPGPQSDGGVSTDQACQAYLSCLLVSAPSSYAAALALYGEKAACWDSPTQAANCRSACVSELADRSDRCYCSGSTCQAYFTVNSGSYALTVSGGGASDCPVYHSDGNASVFYRTDGFQVQGALATTGGPWGAYTLSYTGVATVMHNGGTIDWDIEGSNAKSTLKLTADDHFETNVDRYSDGSCIYTLRFAKL